MSTAPAPALGTPSALAPASGATSGATFGATPAPVQPLLKTPLHALHLELGARMVPFAGYDMPVQYPAGIMAEHRHCRESAALFDVSHMGQVRLIGMDAALALESLVPVDVAGLSVGQQRYGLFTNDIGGILDDLMITRRESDLLLIVNAACKEADIRHLVTNIGHRCTVQALPERALLALQGPLAVQALGRLNAEVATLTFMTGGTYSLQLGPFSHAPTPAATATTTSAATSEAAASASAECFITRSGYTGEDGFEISVAAEQAEALARALLAQPEVKPCGLGARDTLRLEAGLCLYGHDINATTTPVEAGLTWAIQKVRRAGGARGGGYPGAAVIDGQFASGAASKRVGLVGVERAPVREGTTLVDGQGQRLGTVTTGTLAPSVNQVIAMAYLPLDHAQPGNEVFAEVRGKRLPMTVAPMPFNPHRYFRG